MANDQTDLLLKIRADVQDAIGGIRNLQGEFGGLQGAIEALTSPTAMLTVGIGALVAGATMSVKAFLDDAQAARELAFQTGLTTEQAHALSEVMKLTGSSADILQMAMMRLSFSVQTGGKGLAELGVGLRDAQGNLKPLGELFLQSIDRLASMSNETQRNNEMIKLFGRGSAELIPLIEQWNSGLREQYVQMSQNSAMTEEETKRAQELERQYALLKNTMHEWAVDIGAWIVPHVNALIEGMKGLAHELANPLEALKQTQIYFRSLDEGFTGFTSGVKANATTQAAIITGLGETTKKEVKSIVTETVQDVEAANKMMLSLALEAAKTTKAPWVSELQAVDMWKTQTEKQILDLYKFKSVQEAQDALKNKATENVAKQALADIVLAEEAADAKRRAIHDALVTEYGKKEEELGRKIVQVASQNYKEEQQQLKLLTRDWQNYFSSIGHFLLDFTKDHKQALKQLESSIIEWLIQTLAKTAAQNVASTLMHEAEGIAAANAMAPETFGASLAWIPQIIASAQSAVSTIMGALGLAEGGLVKARPGGVLANLGEGGVDELVIPLNKLGHAAGPTYHITVPITTYGRLSKQDGAELGRVVGDGIMSRLRTLRTV